MCILGGLKVTPQAAELWLMALRWFGGDDEVKVTNLCILSLLVELSQWSPGKSSWTRDFAQGRGAVKDSLKPPNVSLQGWL